MLTTLPLAIGGLGLFPVGMTMLTEGLRTLAGGRLRSILRQSTDNPTKGAIAGALTTAMVQSSSATTVAAVGFVAAGLMTFQQSLGIIFGANIGTTLTGWLVALLGFKLNLGTFLTPFILLGVFMKMFAPANWKGVGWALAGFGILFLGIEGLKEGMVAFRDIVTPERFPSDTFLGRLQLVLLGVLMTIVTQSSSAGVASALAALSVGAINLPQAAALVIGMDVGTTVTALIATVGGATAARRTGSAHVIYNLLTGGLAFALLYPIGWMLESEWASGFSIDPQIALVGFHTTFNFIGVLAILGVTGIFARFVIWLIPEHEADLTRHLERQLLSDPKAALDASIATTKLIAKNLFGDLEAKLTGRTQEYNGEEKQQFLDALTKARRYVESIATDADSLDQDRQFNLLFTLDHLGRLHHRLTQDQRIQTVRRYPALRERSDELLDVLASDRELSGFEELSARTDVLRKDMRSFRWQFRGREIHNIGRDQKDPTDLNLRLDSARWLQRTAYHLWRIAERMRQIEAAEWRPERHRDLAEEESD